MQRVDTESGRVYGRIYTKRIREKFPGKSTTTTETTETTPVTDKYAGIYANPSRGTQRNPRWLALGRG